MKKHHAIYFALCSALVCSDSLIAATYYVRTNGVDTASGLNDTSDPTTGAWRTASKAASTVSAGDTVLFGPGDFTNRISTVTAGTSGSPIVWDGRNQATITYIDVNAGDAWNTFQNFTLNRATSFGEFASVETGCDGTVISNCLAICTVDYMGGIVMDRGTAKPFDSTAANNCIFINNTFTNLSGEIGVALLAGTNNLFKGNTAIGLNRGDGFRLFGKYNIVRSNYFHWQEPSPDISGHSDFFQTFGVSGDGSMGHLIEANTFVGDCTPTLLAEGVVDAGRTVALGQLTMGSDPPTLPATYTTENITLDGDDGIVAGRWYEWRKGANDIHIVHDGITNTTDVQFELSGSSVTIKGTLSAAVTCELVVGTCWFTPELFGGWVIRSNLFMYAGGGLSAGIPNQTYQQNTFWMCNSDPARGGHPLAFSYVYGRNNSSNSVVQNNAFVNCGNTNPVTGWYEGDATDAAGLTADYNFVSKVVGVTAWSAVDSTPPRNSYDFVEDHGVNGGNPLFTSVTEGAEDFRLTTGSPLIGAASGGGDIGSIPYSSGGGGSSSITSRFNFGTSTGGKAFRTR